MNHPTMSASKERLYRVIGIMLTSTIVYSFYVLCKKYYADFEYYVPDHKLRFNLLIDLGAVPAVIFSLCFYFTLYYI